MKQIDTSGLSFIRLREEDMYYVDKSLLIKDIIESNRCGIYLSQVRKDHQSIHARCLLQHQVQRQCLVR